MAITSEIIRQHKESAILWRERRVPEWNENYYLYRCKVTYNRLTQRQAVMIPLMKYIIRTLLKDIDEPPALTFNSLDNDEENQMNFNMKYKHDMKENKMILKDIVDKKNVLLTGRSFKKQTVVNGKYKFTIESAEDLLVDRYIDPTDIDSGSFYCHQHIYVPLSELEQNEDFNQDVVKELKKYYGTQAGLIKQGEIRDDMIQKNERMETLGVIDVENPILGETYVELNDILMYDLNDKGERVLHYVVQSPIDDVEYEAENGEVDDVLMCKPLSDYLDPHNKLNGYWDTHTNLSSWADDVESTDFYSDGVADTIRGPAQQINTYYSQESENRILQNFKMKYYDTTKSEEFIPQTFTPEPWGWYPVPGNPNDIIHDVDVEPLGGNLDMITFVKSLAEQASAATAANQGQVETRKVTLGEVELTLQEAKERVKSMAVFYMDSWEDFGTKYAMIHMGVPELFEDIKISKKGRYGKLMYTKVITYKDWMCENGWSVEVKQVSDKSNEDTEQLQKLDAGVKMMPGNIPLIEIAQRKLTEFIGLTLEEQQSVLDFEKQKRIDAMNAADNPPLPDDTTPALANDQSQQDPALIGQLQALKSRAQQLIPTQ